MKEVLQVAYLRHLQDFYLFESVKDGVFLRNYYKGKGALMQTKLCISDRKQR